MNSVLALIPARGGSKGIRKKNLTLLGGKSLLARAVQEALRSRSISRVLVSTDSEEIAREARRLGAEAPFLRPRSISGDRAPVSATVRHALDWLESREGWIPEAVALLQPTSPFRTSLHIDEAARLLRRSGADAVIGVCRPATHPWSCVRFHAGKMRYAVPRPPRPMLRQNFPEVYAVNGALYIVKTEAARKWRFTGSRVAPLVMEARESLDIDDPEDLALAEALMRARRR